MDGISRGRIPQRENERDEEIRKEEQEDGEVTRNKLSTVSARGKENTFRWRRTVSYDSATKAPGMTW